MSSYVPTQQTPPPSKTELPYATDLYQSLQVTHSTSNHSSAAAGDGTIPSTPVPSESVSVIDFGLKPFFYLNMTDEDNKPSQVIERYRY